MECVEKRGWRVTCKRLPVAGRCHADRCFIPGGGLRRRTGLSRSRGLNVFHQSGASSLETGKAAGPWESLGEGFRSEIGMKDPRDFDGYEGMSCCWSSLLIIHKGAVHRHCALVQPPQVNMSPMKPRFTKIDGESVGQNRGCPSKSVDIAMRIVSTTMGCAGAVAEHSPWF